jgi:hypothetical protein
LFCPAGKTHLYLGQPVALLIFETFDVFERCLSLYARAGATPRSEIDDRYLDSPYYIAPTAQVGQEAFAVIRDAIREKGMVALGRVVVSRREYVVMLEAFDKGLLAVPRARAISADQFAWSNLPTPIAL